MESSFSVILCLTSFSFIIATSGTPKIFPFSNLTSKSLGISLLLVEEAFEIMKNAEREAFETTDQREAILKFARKLGKSCRADS